MKAQPGKHNSKKLKDGMKKMKLKIIISEKRTSYFVILVDE